MDEDAMKKLIREREGRGREQTPCMSVLFSGSVLVHKAEDALTSEGRSTRRLEVEEVECWVLAASIITFAFS